MQGIAAISQRMAQIQALVAPPVVVRATPTAGATTGTSFADALAEEVARTTPATSAARLNGDGVPTELAAYDNGKVPASALHEVGTTGHRLWEPAARALTGLISAAAADGVTVGITDSYRSYASQVDVAQRKGLYSQGGLAAAPGTSDHGWGMAVDLKLDATAQAWMRAHGAEHGFVEDTPREPWHWGYTP
jgi:LAS superfamily LD-carboxypeptidase LdcB